MKFISTQWIACFLFLIFGCGGNSEINVIDCDPSNPVDEAGVADAQNVDAVNTYCASEIIEPLVVKPSPDMPEAQTVVGGDGNLYEFARYMVYNPNQHVVTVDGAILMQTDPNGDVADFDTVKISGDQKGRLLGNLSIGDLLFVHAITTPLEFQPHETVLIQVKALMSTPVPLEIGDGAWNGYPRVGHTPALKLVDLTACLMSAANIAEHETNSMTLVACQNNCTSD